MSAGNALKAKEKGNKLFKEGKLAESVKHYQEAERLDTKNAVYPSNLSAALYELGDYTSAFHAVLRSCALDPEPALALKLSTRLAKTLSHGLRNGTLQASVIEQNRDAIRKVENEVLNAKDASENEQAWKLWRATRANLVHHEEQAHEDRVRLSKMPIYKSSSDPRNTYFTFGMDDIISLVHGWGPKYEDPINLRTLNKRQLGSLAFLVGGAADARHVYGTVVGLGESYAKLPPAQKKDLKIHITLNDIYFAPIARDFLHLLIIDKLIDANLDEPTRLELEATLVYSFVAWIVPGYVHDRLVSLCQEAKRRLTSDQPDLPPWIHVEENSIPPILRALDFWMKDNNYNVKDMLEVVKHESNSVKTEKIMSMGMSTLHLPPGFSLPSFPGFDPLEEDRREAEKVVNRLPDSVLMELLGGSNERTRALLKLKQTQSGKKELVDFVLKANLDKVLEWGLVWESKWYQETRTFIPHGKLVEAGKHPGFDYFKDVATKKGPHEAKLKQVVASVRKTWKPNITTFDGNYNGYVEIALDDLAFIAQIAAFNDKHGFKIKDAQAKREWPAFAYVMTFFGEVINTIKTLKDRLKIEILCGDINAELTKMRLRTDSTRPADFPRQFTRIWVSNIPDYTHGTLGTVLYMVPSLQEDKSSAVTANCLFNTTVWKDDDEFCFNYTMLLPHELKRYLGVHTINKKALMDILTLGHTTLPRPLNSLASREELHLWLSRLLLSIVSPGQGKKRPDLVKLPFNLVAFIQLLVELCRIGYPGHWPGDFLQSVLNGTLQVNHLTYKDFLPRPVSDLSKTVEPHRVRLDPWFADLEVILANARHALPFAIQLPEGFVSTPDDIGLYKARPIPNMLFSNWSGLQQNDAVLALLFYKSAADLSTRGVDDFLSRVLPSLVDGREAKPAPGSVHVIAATEGVDLRVPELKWRMSRALVAKMKRERWSMVVWRMDCYAKTTEVSPSSAWEQVL